MWTLKSGPGRIWGGGRPTSPTPLWLRACMVISFGRNVEKSYTYNILENSQTKPLARTEQIKDLGILLDGRLSFRDHINDKINKAFSMLSIIKRNFKHLTIQSFTVI